MSLTCGETSEAGWVERWEAWPGQASRDGRASSSGPGSGCVCTLDLWTRGNLCLCSERDRGGKRGERERCYWKCYQVPHSTSQTRRRNSRTQSSKFRPDLHTQARVLLGDNAWRNENHRISFAISLNISLPSLQKKKKKFRVAFSD